MTAAPELGVGVVGFGWMGQVHARAHCAGSAALPGRPAATAAGRRGRHRRRPPRRGRSRRTASSRPSPTGSELIARDDVDVVSVCGPNFVHREIAVAAAARGQARLGREAGRTQPRRHGRRSPRPCTSPGCSRPSASTTGNAPAVAAGARAGRRPGASDGSRRSDVPARATTPRTPTVRCRGGSTRSTPGPACSATWRQPRPRPGGVRAGATAPATSPSWWPTRRRSSRERPEPSGVVSHFSTASRRQARPGRQRGPGLRAASATRRVPAA